MSYARIPAAIGAALVLCTALVLPSAAQAASSKTPTCSLSVTTRNGTVDVTKKGKILVNEGDTIRIDWTSKNAKLATDSQKGPIQVTGTASYSPKKTTVYAYRFTSGSKKADCSFTAYIADATIDKKSLSTEGSKPTLTGTASGTKTVRVIIRSSNGKNTLYTGKDVRVKRGKWEVKVPKEFEDDTYKVEILGTKGVKLNTVATDTLTIGKIVAGSSSSFSVSMIPLLFGGTATAGSSVPVTYLKVTNTSKETSTMNGIVLKQNGSAPVSSVIGFSTSDDKGGSIATIGGTEGSTPFGKSGTAFVPISASFAPGQFRIFTIKALLSKSTAASTGKNLMLDVASLDTDGAVAGLFPVRGTTWTLSY